MKLVVFDCDGTLVDSQHMIVAAMERAFSGAGLVPPPPAKVRRVIGLSLVGAVEVLLEPELRNQAADLAEAYKTGFRELRSAGEIEEPLFPGVREAILELASREDVVLGIATGKSRRGVDAVLEREQLAGRFVTIQTADEHPSKPDPSMVLQALAETGAEPGRTLVVGDTVFDMEMASQAGVRAVGVGWGYHDPAELIEAGAHLVVAESPELLAALRGLVDDGEVKR